MNKYTNGHPSQEHYTEQQSKSSLQKLAISTLKHVVPPAVALGLLWTVQSEPHDVDPSKLGFNGNSSVTQISLSSEAIARSTPEIGSFDDNAIGVILPGVIDTTHGVGTACGPNGATFIQLDPADVSEVLYTGINSHDIPNRSVFIEDGSNIAAIAGDRLHKLPRCV